MFLQMFILHHSDTKILDSKLSTFQDSSQQNGTNFGKELLPFYPFSSWIFVQLQTRDLQDAYIDRHVQANGRNLDETDKQPGCSVNCILQAGEKGHKWGIQPGFETQGRRHQKSKTGVSVAPQKELVTSTQFLKKEYFGNLQCIV